MEVRSKRGAMRGEDEALRKGDREGNRTHLEKQSTRWKGTAGEGLERT